MDIVVTDGTSSSEEEHQDHFNGVENRERLEEEENFEIFKSQNINLPNSRNLQNGDFWVKWTDPTDRRHYGNCRPFLYYRGEPLCVLGPDCKHF